MKALRVLLIIALTTPALAQVKAPKGGLKVTISADTTPIATETPKPTPRAPLPPVVDFKKLLALLPKVPAGWTAEEPNGSLTDLEVFQLSTAARIYEKGDDETALVTTVTLIDAGGHKGYFEAVTGRWQFKSVTPEAIDRAVEIDGMPGFEHIDRVNKTASLSVLVGNRYFVQIDTRNQPEQELREWLKRLDLKALAELKP